MSGSLRLVRSLAAAAIATFAGLLFHHGAQGAGSVLAVLITFVLALWVGAVLSRRRLRTISLIAVVTAAQFALHILMGVFSTAPLLIRSAHSGRVLVELGAATGGHGGGGHISAGHSSGASDHAAHGDAALTAGASMDWPMLLAHACAVLVTVAFLKAGEDMLLALLSAVLGPMALAWASRTQYVRRRPLVVPAAPELHAVSPAVLGSRFRRGPPVAASV